MLADLQRYAKDARTRIRLGIFSAVTREQISGPFVNFLLRNFPEQHLELELLSRAEGLPMLEQGQLDLFLTHINEDEQWDGYQCLAFRESAAKICVSRDHPWADRDAVTLDDLAGETFIALRPARASYKLPDGKLFYDNIPCKEAVSARNFDTFIALLEQGIGFAVFPVDLSNIAQVKYKTFPYPGRQLKFNLALVSRQGDQSETIQHVLEAAQHEYGLYRV